MAPAAITGACRMARADHVPVEAVHEEQLGRPAGLPAEASPRAK